jgi:ParB family transcriptional regulator, chromosome partitioning protein
MEKHPQRPKARPGTSRRASSRSVRIRVDALSPAPNSQPRTIDDAQLQALASSSRRSGVREPIVVVPQAGTPGRFHIVAGERRWRAAQIAGLEEVPCLVDPRLTEERARLAAQAEEDVQRGDIDVVKEMAILVHIMDALDLDATEAGAIIGRNYKQARRLMQIHTAVEPIKAAIVSRGLDARAALELIRIYNRLARRKEPGAEERARTDVEGLIERVASEGWSIRRLERYARQFVQEANVPASESVPKHPAEAGRPVSRRVRGWLLIDAARLERGELQDEERSQLIALLEDLLRKVRRA